MIKINVYIIQVNICYEQNFISNYIQFSKEKCATKFDDITLYMVLSYFCKMYLISNSCVCLLFLYLFSGT